MGSSSRNKNDEKFYRIRIGGNGDEAGDARARRKRYNRVKTTKYTLLTFVPLNFYEQFRRAVYFYFLVVTIISFFVNSTLSPLTSLLPLLFVMFVTALKEGVEDYRRYKSDKLVNETKVCVLSADGKLQEINAECVAPGDLVVVQSDADVPCDLVLLQTGDRHCKCNVSTANLDGETNLKALLLPRGLPAAPNLHELGTIVCEPPTTDLYSFSGRIDLATSRCDSAGVLPLTADNLLLRGARCQNADSVIGCAVYTGMQTKLQLNSRYTGNKSPSSEVYINRYMMVLIVGMLIVVALLYIIERIVESGQLSNMTYLGGTKEINEPMTIIDDFLAFLILFNYMVPISMYMNIELYRIFGAYFIRSDLQLYDPATDQPCSANTSNLNEDLGQVNILFSDKTGTLTKNEMTFKQCSIAGSKYHFRQSHLENVATGVLQTLSDFDSGQLRFVEALSICHSVQVIKGSSEPADWRYQASSPDEIALLEACSNLGLSYVGDIDDICMCVRRTSSEQGVQDILYERLQVLEFTPERKRMSIIVRHMDNRIWLYSKGAESSIYPLCDRSASNAETLIAQTDAHITEFAHEGLRTLAVARRSLSSEEYAMFVMALDSAHSSLEQRQQLIAACYAQVECELELLGATAVEDALQENVAETLTALQAAGLRIWVLTGDKVETAVNIGLACQHIPATAHISYMLGAWDATELLQRVDRLRQYFAAVAAAAAATRTHVEERPRHALVIDGVSLDLALTHARSELCELALMCEAVLCCRLSPLQKSEVVAMIRARREYLTAAIGDGANDVSMLQAAHVGIGIMGREGRQAARCADYAIARFDMLPRLLLVHGQYNSVRLAFLVLFYCYKNVVITGCMALYQLHDFFSATAVYSAVHLWFFDFLYLSFSFMLLTICEKPYDERTLLCQPALYKRNAHNRQASWSTFGLWMLNALLHMLIIFYFSYGFVITNDVLLGGGQIADYYCFGVLLFTLVIVVGNLKVFLVAHFLNYLNIIFIASGIVVLIFSTYVDNLIGTEELFGVYSKFVSSLSIWLFIIVTTVACLLTDFTIKAVKEAFLRTPRTHSIAAAAAGAVNWDGQG